MEAAAQDVAVWNRALPLAFAMLRFFEGHDDAERVRALDLHALQVELELAGTQAPKGTIPAIERTSILPCRALLDTGALGDFISATELAVQGSRSKIHCYL